jgi:hypothetical protein
MGTKDVRIDTRLNKAIWAQGVRGTPFRHFYASGIKFKTVESSRSEHWERQVKDLVSFFSFFTVELKVLGNGVFKQNCR